MKDFHCVIEQYLMDQDCLSEDEPNREVYKAMPKATYEDFLTGSDASAFLKRHGVKLFVHNP